MAATTSAALVAAVLLCAACCLVMTAHAGPGFGRRQNHYKWKRAAVVRHRLNQKAAPSGDLVSQTCTNVSRSFCTYRITEEACVSDLRLDKRSADAKDARNLTLLAIDLVKLSAAAVDAKIAAVLKEGDKDKERSLQCCRLYYDVMARLVPICRAVVEHYDPAVSESEVPYDYDVWTRRLMHAAMECQGEIFNVVDDETAALWKEVHEVVQRTRLVNALKDQMLGLLGGQRNDEDGGVAWPRTKSLYH